MLFIMAFATKIIMPYDTLSEFFDGLADGQMSDTEKGALISYGSNDTHCFVEESFYDEADPLPSLTSTETS